MKKSFLIFSAVILTMSMSAATYTLEPGENKIEAAIASLTDGDVLELQTGNYTEWHSLTFTTKVTIQAAEGASPKLALYNWKIQNDFEINGVEITNVSVNNYLFRVYESVAGTVAFKNCSMQLNADVTSPQAYIIVKSGISLGNLVVDNCLFKDNAISQGAVVLASGSTTNVTNFTMSNSTAYNCGTELTVWFEGLANASVDHCTFYNCGTRELYLKAATMNDYSVQNCVIANATAPASNNYCIATYAGVVNNIVYYNTMDPRSSSSTNTNCINADPQFIDPANGNFNFAFTSPLFLAATDGLNIGDPRWGVEANNAIDIPGTLPLDAAVLSGTKISKTSAAISWNENDTKSTASYEINATKSGEYDVILTETTSSGHNYKVSVIDIDGNILSVSEGKDTWKSGDLTLGQIVITETGNYLVRLENLTAHSASSISAFQFIYKGGGIMPIPGQLPGEEALLAGKVIRLANGSLQWPDKSDVDNHYATWNITAAAAGEADITMYIGTPSSGHCFTAALYDGETLQSSVPEEQKVYTTGTINLGTISIPAAGSYTIRLTNATSWSSAIVDSLVIKMVEAPAELTISENATDNSLLTANLDKTVNVNLVRSMPTGMFSTFCLPFALSSSQIANSQFAGSKIYYLDSTALVGDEVILYFKENSDFYQGVPYLVMPATTINNPSFEGVTIKKDEASTTTAKNNYACFRGTFITKHLEEGNENLLYLGADNTLYFPPSGDKEDMKGLRGYFEVLQTAGAPIRRASIHMGTNVVTTLDLVDGQAIPNGLFMLNGQIEIRINGQKYMLNGMQK